MIRQLQKKFVVSCMLAISILLMVVLGGINIFYMVSSDKQTDNLLSTLSEIENSAITQMLPQVRSSWDLFSMVVTQDDTLGAIYFVAKTDEKGAVWKVDTTHISSISLNDALEYIQIASLEKKESGKVDGFKYQAMKTVGQRGTTYIFLDVTKQTNTVFSVFILSMGIGIICWLVMLLFVILLSKKAISPIAENIEKQKHFVTDAGHEIKTPLAIIMANTDAMELCLGENKYSSNIRTQTERLKILTEHLLTLAKMEEQTKVQKNSFSVSDLIEVVFTQFSEQLERKQITFVKHIPQNMKICSNQQQVQMLFDILMENAVKYVNENGTIRATMFLSGKWIIFELSNTAANLRQLRLEKIFDRFYRGDDARTQKSGGYGIGLSSALAIVQSLKGEITARTQQYEEIIFTVKLPLE